ncbi:head-tail adaptor protein [Clostridium sp. CF012]|uniref:phage head completion protein n=1 Tax=Clostridium sp. CF012 TaxID=2843319 RepID=UPI001C0E2737|nr:head-tail adaptor protein [Clostridium sp. CF012]MBU3145729.1 head-tail adaptor protein [Clostridium sp. CF012]
MKNITNKLNCRAELWGMVPFENELGEQDVKEGKIKEVIYCNILPASASQRNNGVTEVINHSHKFTVRTKSIEDIKVNMFFIFKTQKYEFIYWNPDFKNNEYIEIFTKLVME